MKKLMLALFVLIAGVGLGLFIKNHPAYMQLQIHGLAIAMPMWFAALAIIAAFFLFYIVLRTLGYVFSIRTRYRRWRKQKRELFIRHKTEQGLLALSSGHFDKAERYLLQAAKQHPKPLLNYLACARAAQEQGALDRRDHYLACAQEIAPDQNLAVTLTTARLQLHQGQHQDALQHLQQLQQQMPKHPYVLKLLAKTYGAVGDWGSLANLLPTLSKQKLIDNSTTSALETQVYEELLLSAAQVADDQTLANAWDRLPKASQKEPSLIAVYCQCLIQKNQPVQAEALLRSTLKKNWQPQLVTLYSQVQADTDRQLATAEGWLKTYGENDAALALCLGQLCKRKQLWGMARQYLEQASKLAPQPSTFHELGEVLEQLHDVPAALEVYRRGLSSKTLFAPTNFNTAP